MKRQAIQSAGALLGACLLLAGCANKRMQYHPPVAPQLAKADTWNTPPTGGAKASPADDKTIAQWWSTLGDPVLTALEERAVKGNLDVRQAEAKIRQARAQREGAKGDLYPTVTASGSATGSRTSTRNGGELGQSYGTGVSASWEPDFFNRIRGTVAAYTADVEATQEDLRNVLVSLTAEVALNYVDLRSYQSQLAITRANLAAQEETYKLTVAKYESGLSTELDVQQAALSVESTRAGIPTLETGLQKAENAISVLVGERPGAVDQELGAVKPVPVILAEVAVGLPADLLRRRPDIRSAERQVAAQSARAGVAAANLYPTFNLSGVLSFSSLNIVNLLTPATLAGSLAGSVQQTILNRRQLRAQLNVQDVLLEQYETSYESTVLGALQDVEDALKAFANEQVRRKSLADAAAAAERAATMSRDLYGSGLKDFLTVLDAQRSLLSLQNQLAQSDATITANLIRLYKALGGGWS
ncbi:efflux transporter outer membrane subunit [uncultured Paludibaculum sp.]|uniref:efflux transporter outer membrane subunit n=1 Tax=uncultured Paludibaculum sp. TaxID=1765020 RepID=UPI002AAB649B|nr:efflux transporter outer membrane subunit [uncultured Paludibaculum sp.]